MVNNSEFMVGKKNALDSLDKACNESKADLEILPILQLINDSPNYYSVSSCAGRTVLLEIPRIGDKKKAFFLEKWHRAIKSDEIKEATKFAKCGLIWLLAQSPIIHIVSDNFDNADKMVKSSISCGFKNSGFKSIGKRIVIEICSTERLDAPIGRDGNLFCNDEHLDLLVDIGNDVFLKSKAKLLRFEQHLQQITKK